MRILVLKNNNIEELPTHSETVYRLRFDLSSNNIVVLPDFVASALQHLIIDHNEIERIPDSFSESIRKAERIPTKSNGYPQN